MFKNKNFITLLMAFGQIQGVLITLAATANEATAKFGFTSNDASMLGALFIVGGLVGATGFGIYVEKTKKYKRSLNLLCISSTVFTGLNFFFLPMGKAWLISLVSFFQGAFMVPTIALSIDLGVELTYPIGESFSTGVLLNSGQLWGIFYTLIASYVIDHTDSTGTKIAYLGYASACFIGFIFSLFIKEKLLR